MLPIEQQLLDYIFVDEGGFSNVKGDAGGQTRFGVTEKLARAYGYTGPMDELPKEFAASILLHEFWYRTWMKIQGRPRLAIKLCDTGMNMPPAEAVMIAQRAVNRVAGEERLAVDGGFGPSTQGALLSPAFEEDELLKAVCIEQEAHYEYLEQHYANDIQFTRGWRNRASRIPTLEGGSTHVEL